MTMRPRELFGVGVRILAVWFWTQAAYWGYWSVMKSAFEGMGNPAVSAREALEALEREEFDLLITDFRMPDMSGLELAHAIRKRNPQLPIIVMSVYEPVASEHVTLWLPKDSLFPDLLGKIRCCLCGAESKASCDDAGIVPGTADCL